MSKQSKARDSAFQAALKRMAEKGWGTGHEVLLERRHGDVWQGIWDAALAFARKRHEKQLEEIRRHLNEAQAKAVLVSLDVGSLQASVAGRDEEIANLRKNLDSVIKTSNFRLAKIKAIEASLEMRETEHGEELEERDRKVKTQAGIIEQQRVNLRSQSETITRIRDEKTALRAELAEVRKHTTSATWHVFEENEHLATEIRRLTSLLADAEEKIRNWEGIKKARLRPALVPCLSVQGNHSCNNRTEPGKEHPQHHLCHCGTSWS